MRDDRWQTMWRFKVRERIFEVQQMSEAARRQQKVVSEMIIYGRGMYVSPTGNEIRIVTYRPRVP